MTSEPAGRPTPVLDQEMVGTGEPSLTQRNAISCPRGAVSSGGIILISGGPVVYINYKFLVVTQWNIRVS